MLVSIPYRNTNATNTSINEDQKIEWKVVNLGSSASDNITTISNLTDVSAVRFVMTADCVFNQQHPILGFQNHNPNCEYMVLNLNGYKLSMINCHWTFFSRMVEITDSSDTGNGKLTGSYNGYCASFSRPDGMFIISGGHIECCIDYWSNRDGGTYLVTGGYLDCSNNHSSRSSIFSKISGYKGNFSVISAPYMTGTKNDAGDFTTLNPSDDATYASFTISTSNLVSGSYNYAYGVAWDLKAGKCLLEHITKKNQPYYLWYRNSDNESYQYLLQLA